VNTHTPDFDSIKHLSPYGTEYWSARELAPLLGYTKWERFLGAIQRAITASEQVGQRTSDHFPSAGKMVMLGSGSQREVPDYLLSRFGCYLIAQNGDPRKPAIAAAQVYFAVATRTNELAQLREQQDQRLHLRVRVADNNRTLAAAAAEVGVLSPSFGIFQNAGYRTLYGGLDVQGIKAHKGIGEREELLDRMSAEELAANDFRITQTAARLRQGGVQGPTQAMETHAQVGQTVRRAIEEIGGQMPEDLPAEPTIKPLLEAHRRQRKKLALPPGNSAEDTLQQGSFDL